MENSAVAKGWGLVLVLDDDITSDSIWQTADQLRKIVTQVTTQEFRWEHEHYNHDSRHGRELLFLIANSGWIRTTYETVDITHSDAVDTTIKIDINLDQITHEAFHTDTPYLWLPLLVLPPVKSEEMLQAGSASSPGPHPRQVTRPRMPATAQVSRPHLRLRSTAGHGETPGPVRTLTVSDATGRLIATVPDVDVLHWISAALAEIVVNMAAARWQAPPDGESGTTGARHPVATRDQRLVLSAAIYRLLRSGPADPPAAGDQDSTESLAVGRTETTRSSGDQGQRSTQTESSRPSGRGLGRAREQLTELLDDYIKHYETHLKGPRTGSAVSSAEAVLVERAVQVLEAFRRYAVVVVPVHRENAPATLTVQVPTRPLAGKRWRTYGASRARLFIDVLVPSADADRQVEINLPEGIRFDSDTKLYDMNIEVDTPQAISHLGAVMSQLVSDKVAPIARPCVADLAIVKAKAANETLRHYLCGAVGQSAAELNANTKTIRGELRTLTSRLDRLSAATENTVGSELASIRGHWNDDQFFAGPLQRRTSSDRPSPRALVTKAPMVEDISQRASPAKAWIQVDVGIADAQFFSEALLAGTLSVLIMLLVLGFFLYSLISLGAGHSPQIDHAPSQEVLAAALTLFTAVQAAQIEPADQSTLRGLLSALGWLVIAVSLMPAIVVAVALAFDVSGWAPVWVAIVAIAAEIALQIDFQVLLRRRRVGQIMGIPRRLELQTEPLDYSGYGVLQSEWWRSTTADALKIGRLAHAYVVWERDSPSLLNLVGQALRPDSSPQGSEAADTPMSGARPANILALLRAGTSEQALTFVVFREQAAAEWVTKWDARRVDLDPDRLAPTESATDIVELFTSISRRHEPPVLNCHPLGIILAAAAACRLSVLDVQLPVPSPLAAYSGRTWARVRVGLHDSEIHRLAHFLGTVHRNLADSASALQKCSVLVRTAPERRLRTIFSTPPMRTTNKKHRVTASEIDVITASDHWPQHEQTASKKPWRVIALTANARLGIENEILAKFGGGLDGESEKLAQKQHLKLAGLTYAVVHGIAVALALGYQPEKRQQHDRSAHHSQTFDSGVSPRILIDEWQQAEKLGKPGNDPLLSIRVSAQDRPGTLMDVLRAVNEALHEALPSFSEENFIVWHALTRVSVRNDTRLTARLKVRPRDVKNWDEGKFEMIEQTTRRYIADAVTRRKIRDLSSSELGAPEDTVIGITLIEAPTDDS